MRVINDMNCIINFRRSRKFNVAQQTEIDRHSKMNFFH